MAFNAYYITLSQTHTILPSKNRKVVVTKLMLFQLNFGHKDATVSYIKCNNFQDILPPGSIQHSREYKKFPKSISIHFNCSFMQLQTSDHNNISLPGVCMCLRERERE